MILLDLKDKTSFNYKIGRKTDNDIVFKDISVSWLHTYIYVCE